MLDGDGAEVGRAEVDGGGIVATPDRQILFLFESGYSLFLNG